MTDIKDKYTLIDKIIDDNNIGFDEVGNAEMLDRGELLSLMMQAAEQYHIVKDEDGNIIEPDANGWYKIDDAPYDGKEVLVYSENSAHPVIEEAFWDSSDQYGACWTTLNDEPLRGDESPTHFRPTFNPPMKEGEQ